VGKPASSLQHTFIRLKGDKRVYHGRGNFKSRFDQTLDALRDKVVLSFDTDEIHEITILNAGEAETFSRIQLPEEKVSGEDTSQPSDEKNDAFVWQTPEGNKGDEAQITKLLNTLSDLRCDQFVDGRKKEDFKDPTWTFQLKGAKDYSLSLYAKKDDEKKFSAVSSQSDYPFSLAEWQVTHLTKKIEAHTTGPKEKAEKK
jgi:hypothetical protein